MLIIRRINCININVHQVGYLQELNRDARSTKHKHVAYSLFHSPQNAIYLVILFFSLQMMYLYFL